MACKESLARSRIWNSQERRVHGAFAMPTIITCTKEKKMMDPCWTEGLEFPYQKADSINATL
jgi:hypothetical protein